MKRKIFILLIMSLLMTKAFSVTIETNQTGKLLPKGYGESLASAGFGFYIYTTIREADDLNTSYPFYPWTFPGFFLGNLIYQQRFGISDFFELQLKLNIGITGLPLGIEPASTNTFCIDSKFKIFSNNKMDSSIIINTGLYYEFNGLFRGFGKYPSSIRHEFGPLWGLKFIESFNIKDKPFILFISESFQFRKDILYNIISSYRPQFQNNLADYLFYLDFGFSFGFEHKAKVVTRHEFGTNVSLKFIYVKDPYIYRDKWGNDTSLSAQIPYFTTSLYYSFSIGGSYRLSKK